MARRNKKRSKNNRNRTKNALLANPMVSRSIHWRRDVYAIKELTDGKIRRLSIYLMFFAWSNVLNTLLILYIFLREYNYV
jgi:hypothetical protein